MIKELIAYLVAGLVGLILQGSLLKIIIPYQAVPNVVLILIVHLSFFRQRNDGPLFAFLLGLLFDVFGSHMLLGPYAAASVVIYLCVTSISKRLYIESIMTLIFVVIVATFVFHGIATAITSQFIASESLWVVMFHYAPIEAIGSALIAPFIFRFLKYFRFVNMNKKRAGEAWVS